MKELLVIIGFGALALLVLAGLQRIRLRQDHQFSISFTAGYGLILVATLGVALAISNATGGAKTGAFTLLGTIAGYIAGNPRPPAKRASPKNPNDDTRDPEELPALRRNQVTEIEQPGDALRAVKLPTPKLQREVRDPGRPSK